MSNTGPYGEDTSKWPIQIDPRSCGCTECLIGQYVPLGEASLTQINDMLMGRLGNATGFENDAWLTVRDGDGKIIRIIDPTRNDDFLDAIREFWIS